MPACSSPNSRPIPPPLRSGALLALPEFDHSLKESKQWRREPVPVVEVTAIGARIAEAPEHCPVERITVRENHRDEGEVQGAVTGAVTGAVGEVIREGEGEGEGELGGMRSFVD